MNIFEILKQTTGFEALPTKVLGATVAEDIIITQKAMEHLTNEQQAVLGSAEESQPNLLRLYMRSTADKSKQYCMMFDSQTTEFDNVYQLGKINIVIDRKNLFYFMGIIIDYVENESEKGFVFLDSDDQKVSDYYAMLADKQALADYCENTGDYYMAQNAKTEQPVPSTLYQDEIYDIKEVTAEHDVITEGAEVKLEADIEPDTNPVSQHAESIETDTVANNSQSDGAPAELEQLQSAEPVPTKTMPTDNQDLLDTAKPAQTLPADTKQPVDKTGVVQKRAITGIHFQD